MGKEQGVGVSLLGAMEAQHLLRTIMETEVPVVIYI